MFQSFTRLPTAVGLGAVLVAGLLGACAAPGPATLTTSDSAAQPQHGGTIRYAHLQEPPCVYGGWIQQAYTSRQVLDSLVSQTADGTIVPWLAQSWSVSEDRKTWTFHLRDGVTFTDGTPLDAQAVSDNFEYWLKGGNGTVVAYLGKYYQGSRAVDRSTLEVSLSAPYSPLLSALSQGYFGIQSPTALATRSKGENCEAPIGSGPFTVKEWKRGEYLSFERNPAYNWAPANARHQGPAYVDGIRWSFVQDNTSRYGSLLSNEADAIGEVPSVDFRAAQESYEVQQYITPGRPVTLSLNTVRGPFTDVRVRQAFAFGQDRPANVRSAFLGVVPFEGNGTVSQSTPGYNAETAHDYPYDPQRANRLLDEAGWTGRDADGVRTKDGERLSVRIVFGLNSIVTPEASTALQNLQEQVRPLGFDVVLRPATQSELFGGAFSTPETYDAQLGYWTSPTAGILYINYRQNTKDDPNYSNTTFYNNPRIEQLIIAGNSARSGAEANHYYGLAQQALSDQAVAIGLYTQTSTLATQRDLRDAWQEASQGEPVFHDAYFTDRTER